MFSRLFPSERAAARLVLAAGLTIFVLVQGVLIGVPLKSRSLPPEVDDAYTYIAKSAQMADCFLQDCAALNDLRGPLKAESPNPEIRWQRYRAYVRNFGVFHPLYSVLLIAVHRLGVDWERAYTLIWAAGPVLFAAAIGYWLWALWGPAPAGLALMFLALQTFPGQGLHYVVPTNLALAIAVALWGRLAASGGEAPWALPLACWSLVAMHPTGRLYAMASLALAWLLAPKRPSGRRLVPFALGAAAVLVAALLPHVVSRPEMTFASDPFPSLRQVLVHPYFSLEKAVEALDRWSSPFGSLAATGALIAAGFVLAADGRQRALARTALVLSGLLAGSLLHVLPRYPAELFLRLWVPFAAFMTGALGQAAWSALLAGAEYARAGAGFSRQPPRLGPWTLSGHQAAALALVLAATLAGLGAKTIVTGCATMRQTIVYMRDRHALSLDAEQPRRLMSEARPGDRVVYFNEIPMLFYFSHGATSLGAVFYPAIAGTPERSVLGAPAFPRFAVAFNPLRTAPLTPRGLVRLAAFRTLELRPGVGGSRSLRLWLDNSGGETSLSVAGRAIAVPGRTSGWVRAEIAPLKAGQRLIVTLPDGAPDLALGGVSLGEDSLSWPWRQKARLALEPREPGGEAVGVSFDAGAIIPAEVGGVAEVLDDRGMTVLARLRR